MLNRRSVLVLAATLMIAAGASAARETSPTPPEVTTPLRAEFTARMKEVLSLTDAQWLELEPLITTRVQTVDAALIALESAEKPDVAGFIEGYGRMRKEFEVDVMKVLTADQRGSWDAFKADFETDLVEEGAAKKLLELQAALKLTDEQVTKMRPAMSASLQKKLDLFQELLEDEHINVREERRAKRTLDDLNAELWKSISKVMTVDQRNAYTRMQGQ
ncbi:MAG TPA: hypothetical protein VF720_10685 [Candidatus Eisenbacteria bacterium]